MPKRIEELQRVPLFSGLSQRQLRRLARCVNEREYRAGTAVVRQSEMSGVGFFIIVEGSASVTVDDAVIAKLGPGDHFGELGLISERARTATVTFDEPARCLVLASWDFKKLATENPDIGWKLLQHLVELVTTERARRSQAVRAAS